MAAMAHWGRLARGLQSAARPFQLRIANRLFSERTFRFEQPFLDQTKAAYGAPAGAVDFMGRAADPAEIARRSRSMSPPARHGNAPFGA
jgi:hypothetical protein